MAYLFKHTDLQINFNVNLTCLTPADGPSGFRPGRVSLLDLCQQFLGFRMEVVTRRLQFEKRKLEARLHILDGFHKIHLDLDKAIRIIRRAEGRADAAKKLKAAFKLDDQQVERHPGAASLPARPTRDRQARSREKGEEDSPGGGRSTAQAPLARWKMIKAELEELKNKYGDPRRTKVSVSGRVDLTYDADAYIVHEETTVVLTRDGWIRRVRELKDPKSARLREGDDLSAVLPGTTRDRIVLFSTRGLVYVLAVADVPATTGYGDPVQSLFKFADGERSCAASWSAGARRARSPRSPIPRSRANAASPKATSFDDEEVIELVEATQPILGASARGYGFRAAPDLSLTTRSGRRFARVAPEDELVSVHDLSGTEVLCLAKSGKGVRFRRRRSPSYRASGGG